MRPPGASKHARRFVGVNLRRGDETVALAFDEPITVSHTHTPAWIRKDRRRAANKAARRARKANRP